MASTIKVDNVQNQPGTNVINKCGTTVTIGAGSDNIRSAGNNLQASDGGNLISQSGTTITLGASGDTITLASGASQTGFGREGSVDWQTSSIKTATFTATSGEGYFCNTSGGAFTVNLPAGSAGAIVAVSDYTRTFNSNNLTVSPNGSEKIGGIASDAVLNVDGQAATFVYVDSTEGWINVQNAEDTEVGVIQYMSATGGTITTSGDYKIHTFTGPGTFTVCSVAGVCGPTRNVVDYLVAAGGAGGGGYGGGGGAGGFRFYANPSTNPQSGKPGAPLNAPAGITVTATSYPIAVGGGGAGNPNCNPPYQQGNPGNTSTFSTISSAGGGGGGRYISPTGSNGSSGGSGGGGGMSEHSGNPCGGSGNSPPVSPPQGNPGGNSGNRGGSGPYPGAGGGGGAMASGGNYSGQPGGDGGAGAGVVGFGASNGQCSSCVQYFSGGGGGRGEPPGHGGCGGIGGGGAGAHSPTVPGSSGGAGTANTGGGGGASASTLSLAGGSGIVVIRYKYQ